MMNIDEMKKILEASIPTKRYRHSLAVYETALKLAEAHGLPAGKIAVAALLHDCGRVVSSGKSAQEARKLGLEVPPLEEAQPILLHAILGVYYARETYGVDDGEILEGIRYHTTGVAGMSDLAKVVYLADMIEPGRDFDGVEELRKLAFRNLDKAMLKAYANTIGYLLDSGLLIHPDCIDGYNELLLAARRKS